MEGETAPIVTSTTLLSPSSSHIKRDRCYVPPCDPRKEDHRMASFISLDHDTKKKFKVWKMAENGFWLTGQRDVIKCYSCGRPAVISDTSSSYPHEDGCKFALGEDDSNVPTKSYRKTILALIKIVQKECKSSTQQPPPVARQMPLPEITVEEYNATGHEKSAGGAAGYTPPTEEKRAESEQSRKRHPSFGGEMEADESAIPISEEKSLNILEGVQALLRRLSSTSQEEELDD